MLILRRRVGEAVRIGDGVVVTVLEVRGGRVVVGVEAPPDVRISRGPARRPGGGEGDKGGEDGGDAEG